MNKILKNKKWVLLIVLVVIFISFSISVILDGLNNFDSSLYNLISKLRLDNFFRYVTEFGDAFVFFILILLVFSLTKSKKYTVLLSLNLAGIAMLNFLLKNIFTRERPVGIASILETGFSFPSGHSSVSAAFYIYLAYIIVANVNKKWIKCITIAFFSALVLSIGISRVYLGVHYASDVIAGITLGLIYTILFIHFTKNIKFLEDKKSKKK